MSSRSTGIAVIAVVATLIAASLMLFRSPRAPSPRGPRLPGRGSVVLPRGAGQLAGTDVRMDQIEKRIADLESAKERLAGMEADLKGLEATIEQLAARVERARRGPARGSAPLSANAPRIPHGPEAPEPQVLFTDDFEEGCFGWLVPRSGSIRFTGTIEHATGDGVARSGRGAMKLTFPYEKDALALAARIGISKKTNRVSFWVKTSRPTMIFVSAIEADRSSYGAGFELKPGDGWYHYSCDYRDMALTEGSNDENGSLDPSQVTALAVGDMGAFLDLKGENTIWLDDFRGEYASQPEAEPEVEF